MVDKYPTYSPFEPEDHPKIILAGIKDEASAKKAARDIFDFYDTDKNGIITKEEIIPMIADAYDYFKKKPNYKPTDEDVNKYFKKLDRNKDGKVTIEDLETVCIKYLVKD